jgi:hypothetical protein
MHHETFVFLFSKQGRSSFLFKSRETSTMIDVKYDIWKHRNSLLWRENFEGFPSQQKVVASQPHIHRIFIFSSCHLLQLTQRKHWQIWCLPRLEIHLTIRTIRKKRINPWENVNKWNRNTSWFESQTVCVFSIKHWLMKFRLLAAFLLYFCIYFVYSRRSWEENRIREWEYCVFFEEAQWTFLPLCREERTFCVSSTLEFCFRLKKFAFRVLLQKLCEYMRAFIVRMIFISCRWYPVETQEELSQINNSTRLEFVFQYHSTSINNHLKIVVEEALAALKRKRETNRIMKDERILSGIFWKDARLSLDTL